MVEAQRGDNFSLPIIWVMDDTLAMKDRLTPSQQRLPVALPQLSWLPFPFTTLHEFPLPSTSPAQRVPYQLTVHNIAGEGSFPLDHIGNTYRKARQKHEPMRRHGKACAHMAGQRKTKYVRKRKAEFYSRRRDFPLF